MRNINKPQHTKLTKAPLQKKKIHILSSSAHSIIGTVRQKLHILQVISIWQRIKKKKASNISKTLDNCPNPGKSSPGTETNDTDALSHSATVQAKLIFVHRDRKENVQTGKKKTSKKPKYLCISINTTYESISNAISPPPHTHTLLYTEPLNRCPVKPHHAKPYLGEVHLDKIKMCTMAATNAQAVQIKEMLHL